MSARAHYVHQMHYPVDSTMHQQQQRMTHSMQFSSLIDNNNDDNSNQTVLDSLHNDDISSSKHRISLDIDRPKKRHKTNSNKLRMSELDKEMLLFEEWEKEQQIKEQRELQQFIESQQQIDNDKNDEDEDEDLNQNGMMKNDINALKMNEISITNINNEDEEDDDDEDMEQNENENEYKKEEQEQDDDDEDMEQNEIGNEYKNEDEDEDDDDMDMLSPNSDNMRDLLSIKQSIECYKDNIIFSVAGYGEMILNEFKERVLIRIKEIFGSNDDDILMIDNIAKDRCIYMDRTLNKMVESLNYKQMNENKLLCLDDILFEIQERKRIECKLPNGGSKEFKVFADDYCFELITKIREFDKEYLFTEIDMFHNEKLIELKQDNYGYIKKWSDYKDIFKENMMIDVKYKKDRNMDKAKTVQLFIKNLLGKTLKFEIKSTYFVEDLKCLILEKEAVPMSEQRLIWKGKQLEDGKRMNEYGNINGETLHLGLRLKAT